MRCGRVTLCAVTTTAVQTWTHRSSRRSIAEDDLSSEECEFQAALLHAYSRLKGRLIRHEESAKNSHFTKADRTDGVRTSQNAHVSTTDKFQTVRSSNDPGAYARRILFLTVAV